MLFDLKGKRKRLVQVVYLGLAILFGGGLVLFGVGGNTSGGLIDAFKGGGGDSNTDSAFNDVIVKAERRAALHPQDPEARLAVVRAQFNLAASPAGSDAQTGALTDRGQQAIIEVVQNWERYLKLHPKKVDASGATSAALAYGALQEYRKAVRAQELSVKSRPSANGYFQVSDFAYKAGDVKAGDAAAKEAVRRTPSDQRNTVRALIKEQKKQGRQVVKAVEAQKKAQKKAGKQGEPGTNFGPLPGQGAGGQGTATP